MMTVNELFEQVDQLSTVEKWQLVRRMLHSLEHEHTPAQPKSDWHEFLRETYGRLRDMPIERWDQGEYEEREPLTC